VRWAASAHLIHVAALILFQVLALLSKESWKRSRPEAFKRNPFLQEVDFPVDLWFISVFRICRTLDIQHTSTVTSDMPFIHFCYKNLLHSLIFLKILLVALRNVSIHSLELYCLTEFPGRLNIGPERSRLLHYWISARIQ